MVQSGFYEETKGIYRLRVPFHQVYTSVFLVVSGQSLFLVDCATTDEDVDGVILPALRKMGYVPCDLSGIVLTHRHSDHAGGLSRLLTYVPDIEIITDLREIINWRLARKKFCGDNLFCRASKVCSTIYLLPSKQ